MTIAGTARQFLAEPHRRDHCMEAQIFERQILGELQFEVTPFDMPPDLNATVSHRKHAKENVKQYHYQIPFNCIYPELLSKVTKDTQHPVGLRVRNEILCKVPLTSKPWLLLIITCSWESRSQGIVNITEWLM